MMQLKSISTENMYTIHRPCLTLGCQLNRKIELFLVCNTSKIICTMHIHRIHLKSSIDYPFTYFTVTNLYHNNAKINSAHSIIMTSIAHFVVFPFIYCTSQELTNFKIFNRLCVHSIGKNGRAEMQKEKKQENIFATANLHFKSSAISSMSSPNNTRHFFSPTTTTNHKSVIFDFIFTLQAKQNEYENYFLPLNP